MQSGTARFPPFHPSSRLTCPPSRSADSSMDNPLRFNMSSSAFSICSGGYCGGLFFRDSRSGRSCFSSLTNPRYALFPSNHFKPSFSGIVPAMIVLTTVSRYLVWRSFDGFLGPFINSTAALQANTRVIWDHCPITLSGSSRILRLLRNPLFPHASSNSS